MTSPEEPRNSGGPVIALVLVVALCVAFIFAIKDELVRKGFTTPYDTKIASALSSQNK